MFELRAQLTALPGTHPLRISIGEVTISLHIPEEFLLGVASRRYQEFGAGGGGGNPVQPIAASISFCDDGVAGCPAASGFSVETARDIIIQIVWTNGPAGNHVQTLALSMPGGGLYQQTQTAFLIDGNVPGTITLKRILPVAATWIQQRSIAGRWTVEAALEGQPITSQMLEMNP